jgi:hypothetical protein
LSDLEKEPFVLRQTRNHTTLTMSGAELMAVVGCIAAVVSAYNDGSDLVRKVRERRRQRREALQHAQHFAKPPSPDTPTQELERSLISGKDVVQHEYDRRYRRFGDPFAKGDGK